MGRRDFFTNLPSEITINILSRLPLRSISISKCVCKSWLNVLNSDHFEIKFPLALVTLKMNPSRCTIFEIEDKGEADLESHDLNYIPLTDFETPLGITSMECTAANGLLLLYPDKDYTYNHVCICNPLTREYIGRFCPINYSSLEYPLTFDFCMSKISSQYKVICIVRANEYDYFQVYTLGTGKWRRVEAGAVPGMKFYSYGDAECNGNLLWIEDDLVQPYFQICAFDVETECFSFFSPPPALPGDGAEELTVFRDCLCICYSRDYEIIIWSMKEYRVEELWTIEYKLSTTDFDISGSWIYPVKVFKDGDILMLLHGYRLIYYSNKTRNTHHVGMFNDAVEGFYFTSANVFTPSLFSLKSFEFENVISF